MRFVFGPRRPVALPPPEVASPALAPPAPVCIFRPPPDPRQYDAGRGLFLGRVNRQDPSVATFKTVETKLFRVEPPRPFPGATVTGRGTVPSVDTTSRATPFVFARSESPRPYPGAILQGIGHVPANDVVPAVTRVVVAQAQNAPPYPGGVWSLRGGVDSASLVPAVTKVVMASAQNAPPFLGAVFSARGGVDSASLVPPPPPVVTARREEMRPAPGQFQSQYGWAVWWPMPAVAQVFRREEMRPEPGRVIAGHAFPAVTAQTPTPPAMMFRMEPPRPFAGWSLCVAQSQWQYVIPIISTIGYESFVAQAR